MKILTSLFLVLLSITTSAQFHFDQTIDKDNCRAGESIEYCRTHKLMNRFKEDTAKLAVYHAEQQLMQEIQHHLDTMPPNRVVYKIPIVFHVLHNGGIENISKTQIEDAVSILNRDFRLQNTDANNVQSTFTGMPADVEVEFELARKAPNGQCFSGITRTLSSLTNDGSNGANQVSAIIAGNNVYNNSWPGNKYLNIFVVNDAGGAAGYTTNPSVWTGSSMTNGIWILHDYVGSVGTSDTWSSRSLTHEVGHWLNLEHTWSDNNNPGNPSSCSSDDGVDDTPRCIGVTSCNLTSNTCSNDAMDGYWTSDVVDNIENYMEYSYCSKMYTSGQKNRMRAALVSGVAGRNNLWSTSNHNATGLNTASTVCAVDIRVDRDILCGGDVVQFYDESYNNINTWSWSFPGGTPATSTVQNPSVSYSSPGTYDVLLQVSDPSGNTLSQTFPNYITVIGNPGLATPYSEGFENVTSVPNVDWTISNPSGPGFQVVTSASSSGGKSIKLDNSQGSNGDEDELISNTINLSNLASATLSFKYAFAKRNSQNSDYMQVLASSDCGETWFLRKNISSSQIATVSNTNSTYTPSGSDWKNINVTGITNTYLVSDFRFKFKFINGGGNDLYIDDINLSGPLSLNENEILRDVAVYPNPAYDNVVLSFHAANTLENASVKLLDASGRIVKNIAYQDFLRGENNVEFSIADLANGWYLVSLESLNRKMVVKLIKN